MCVHVQRSLFIAPYHLPSLFLQLEQIQTIKSIVLLGSWCLSTFSNGKLVQKVKFANRFDKNKNKREKKNTNNKIWSFTLTIVLLKEKKNKWEVIPITVILTLAQKNEMLNFYTL